MKQFIALYSKQFDNINEDIVVGIRKKDNMTYYIEKICEEIEKTLPNNIKYLGFTYDDSGKSIRDINIVKNNKKKLYSIDVNKTYARLVNYKFKLHFDNVTRIVDMPIYIPLFFDDYHYLIRGNKYAAPYQLTDSIIYTNRDDMIVIKTMTRPLKMSREKCVITSVFGEEFLSHEFYIHVTSKKIPFLLFYFAYFGFNRTAKYFGCEKFISYHSSVDADENDPKTYFKFGSIYIGVERKRLEDNYLLRQYIASVLSLNKKGLTADSISRASYWKMILGSMISEHKTLEKGQELLNTFILVIDTLTLNNINRFMGTERSKFYSTFSVVRWMFIEYSKLSSHTNGLENKRIRLSEYQVTPLIKLLYSKLYRYMNTANKDENRLIDIFKVSPAIILNAIIGKTSNKSGGGLNIAKFSSYVNDLALFNVALKYTSAGPGSPIERSGKLASAHFRKFDSSFVGRIDLIPTSNNDPGISGIITPSAKLDTDSFTFKNDD